MKTLTPLLFFSIINVFNLNLFAGEVWKVRGNKVLIEFDEDEPLRLHRQYILTHPANGKQMGLVEVTKKKGTKANALLVKGSAVPGAYTTPVSEDTDFLGVHRKPTSFDPQLATKSDEDPDQWLEENTHDNLKDESKDSFSNSNEPNDNEESETKRFIFKPGQWGFGIGVTPTSLQLQQGNKNYNLKSNNFVIRISHDQSIEKSLNLTSGISILPVGGSTTDDNLGIVKVDSNFLFIDASLRFSPKGDLKKGLWLGGGLGYLWGVSQSSNLSGVPLGNRLLGQMNLGYNLKMDAEFMMLRYDLLLHPQTTSSNSQMKVTQSIFSVIYFF